MRAVANMLATPWQILVSPTNTCQQLIATPQWWPAFMTQWILVLLSSLVVRSPMLELLESAGVGGGRDRLTPSLVISLALLLFFWLIICNLLAAALLKLAAALVGGRVGYRLCLVAVTHGFMPIALGYVLSAITFLIIQPLSVNPIEAVTLSIKPYSFGLATLAPHLFPPATFAWFLASYLDVLGLWALVLIVTASLRFLGLSKTQAIWLAGELMLLSFAVITGWWQITQRWLLSIGG
ncbi:YIP1 family protein [bacterium]|nr:YIP1 family protein [bacterium]